MSVKIPIQILVLLVTYTLDMIGGFGFWGFFWLVVFVFLTGWIPTFCLMCLGHNISPEAVLKAVHKSRCIYSQC